MQQFMAPYGDPDQFDIPAGWQLHALQAQKEKEQQFTCPATHN